MMEGKKFDVFMIFMAVVLTLFFLSLKIAFIVSLLCSLLMVLVIRACWILFNLLWKFIGGVNIGSGEVRTKKFKG